MGLGFINCALGASIGEGAKDRRLTLTVVGRYLVTLVAMRIDVLARGISLCTRSLAGLLRCGRRRGNSEFDEAMPWDSLSALPNLYL